MHSPEQLRNTANFCYEIGILSKTPRSGFHFLGSGEQSVAEHVCRNAFLGMILAQLDGTVEAGRVVQMCLLHDVAEARTSDLNYVHQKYVKVDEDQAHKDLIESVPFGEHIKSILDEYHERTSRASLLAKDADNLEFILSLKEQADIGNKRADSWMDSAIKRLKTDIGKQLAEVILQTPSDAWWFGDPNNSWWVNRNKKQEKETENPTS